MISRSPARGVVAPKPATRAGSPFLVDLADVSRAAAPMVGAKAANLARAAALGLPVLPGCVILPHPPAERGALVSEAWARLFGGGRQSLVVRSSSALEDGAASSMAGRFTSVVGVQGWPEFVDAVDRVIASGARVAGSAPAAPMAVLVQPMLDCAVGGVLFGVDPITGDARRLLVAATAGGPDRLVSGMVSGARIRLTRHGRVVDVDGDDLGSFPSRRQRMALVRLAARVEEIFGGPQDVEWAFDPTGALWLFQSRPITAVAPAGRATGPRFGPGPVAETFPEPLAPLEQALWVDPLRCALALTLRLTGSAGRRSIKGSPLVVTPGGRVAVDLDLVEGPDTRRSWRRIDPRPSVRRLGAAWRVGRLRAALPSLGRDLVEQADRDLAEVPALDGLSDESHLRLLRRCRDALVALHAQEMLAGMIGSEPADGGTAAQLALRRLVAARVENLSDGEIVSRFPEVLALTAPAVRSDTPLPPLVPARLPPGEPGGLAPREGLRLRCRWVQELMGRSAFELGRRLTGPGMLREPEQIRLLGLAEIETALRSGVLPVDLDDRRAPAGPPLPAAFHLGADGSPVPVAVRVRRTRRGSHRTAAHGYRGSPAGGGRGGGPVADGTGALRPGEVLVVRTLDPGLAVHLPGLGGLVAETGSVLSHLAILAREFGVPTVVGVPDAVNRFRPGALVVVDGTTGDVSLVDAS